MKVKEYIKKKMCKQLLIKRNEEPQSPSLACLFNPFPFKVPVRDVTWMPGAMDLDSSQVSKSKIQGKRTQKSEQAI